MSRLFQRLSSFGVFLALLSALSLAAAGGAHRIAVPTDVQEIVASYYGKALEICGEIGGTSGPSADCPVCHLVSAVVLPAPVQAAPVATLRFVVTTVQEQSQRTADTPLDPAHGLRAPPLV